LTFETGLFVDKEGNKIEIAFHQGKFRSRDLARNIM